MVRRWNARIARLPLIIEALCYLAAAKAVIHLLPFASLAKRIKAPAKPLAGELPLQTIRTVCSSVSTAERKLAPWAVCLPQAVAGHWMLRRRGIASVVCFGIGRDSKAILGAHAWLRISDTIVLGAKAMPEFTPIAELPPEP
jgi:hypothetical protein